MKSHRQNFQPLLASFMLVAVLLPGGSSNAASPELAARSVECPPITKTNSYYTGSRAPLRPVPLLKLNIGSTIPKGWLREQLRLQAEGMTGRLPEISKWCEFNGNAWSSPDGAGHSGWEELPYWLKGFGDLAYVLGEPELAAQAQKWINAVLASQQPDGWFGPKSLRTSLEGKPDLWPHMVMCNVLQSYHEYTRDPRVIPCLTKYFRWLHAQPPEIFGNGYWPKMRAGDNIESVHWLYNRTGEPWLLDLARGIHQNMARWDQKVVNWHNVNIAQGFRAPAMFYVQDGSRALLDAAERNYREVMGTYGQFPGGGFAGDENCRPGYVDPRQGFETCGWVEFMHSFELLTRISGEVRWADRTEEIAFNSLPAALTPDGKALHYLTCANQVQLDKNNKAPGIQNGGTMFSYSPYQVYRCCQHNVSHGWPYFVEEMWAATPDNGLCAMLYAPGEVTARVADGTEVSITEETDYPFGEAIQFTVSTPRPLGFPLYFRIPGWCEKPSISVNGLDAPWQGNRKGYVMIDREWADGDQVMLRLPMRVSLRRWAANHDSVSVDYGPLTFSLKIGERWSRYGGSDEWPEWEVFPTTPWNYGLVIDDRHPERSFRVVTTQNKGLPQPFALGAVPIEIVAKARKIPAWQTDSRGLVAPLQPSPAITDQAEESVTLIPMGAARLRITAFPVVVPTKAKTGHTWKEPVRAPVSASHCFEGDSVEAMVDGQVPAKSGDRGVPRFTWWDHRGSSEWVQMDFAKPRKVSSVQIFWFDDTGEGRCRLPDAWKVLYRDGAGWKPVSVVRTDPIVTDRFNEVQFQTVEASALKVEVQLKPDFSAGILEWKVLP